jgi:hypothetical protein
MMALYSPQGMIIQPKKRVQGDDKSFLQEYAFLCVHVAPGK